MKKISKLFFTVIVSLGALALTSKPSYAYLSDEEASQNAQAATGTLDAGFMLVPDPSTPGSGETKVVLTVQNLGSLDFIFDFTYQFVEGNATLCSDATVEVYIGSADPVNLIFSGLLSDISDMPDQLLAADPPPPGVAVYPVIIRTADPGSDPSYCVADLGLKAWQDNLSFPQGFTDEESEEAVINAPASAPGIGAGDVVINEVMWMGSFTHNIDEWVELKNTTGEEIDLSDCEIRNAKAGGKTLVIPSGYNISAHGYFLIAQYEESDPMSALNVAADWVTVSISLADNMNGDLELVCGGVSVDKALGSPWPVGEKTDHLRQSMERNSTPGDGLDASNWHECEADTARDNPAYWDQPNDGANQNYGTPRGLNESENDPSLDAPEEEAEQLDRGTLTEELLLQETQEASPSAELVPEAVLEDG